MILRIAASFVFLSIFNSNTLAQENLNLDMLRSPSSPAFTVLGINPSSIEEPTSPSDLFLSIKNATDTFKAFPSAYSLDFAPGWVFAGKKIDYTDFQSDDFVDAIIQNSVFSIATNTKKGENNSTTNQLGIGLKLSLDRGNFDTDFKGYKEQMDSIHIALDSIQEMAGALEARAFLDCQKCQRQDSVRNALFLELRDEKGKVSEAEYQELVSRYKTEVRIQEAYRREISVKVDAQLKSQPNQHLDYLKSAAENLKFNRSGFKLDFALGASIDFADQKFENGTLGNYGAWLTGGNEWTSKNNNNTLSLLGTSRILLFPDEKYELKADTLTANNLRADFGFRLIYKTANKKLNISTELLSRTVINNDDIPHTYRFAFNFDYALMKNKALTLSIGRDFDGNFTKDGNLIAAINFIAGFGSKRPI